MKLKHKGWIQQQHIRYPLYWYYRKTEIMDYLPVREWVTDPYEVHTAPDTGGWTTVYIPEFGAATQAGHGYEVEDMAREVLHQLTGLPESEIEIVVTEFAEPQEDWWT